MNYFILTAGFLLTIALIVLIRTYTFGEVQADIVPLEPEKVDTELVCAHLARAVSYKTVSFTDEQAESIPAFKSFQQALQEMYPLIHQRLEKQLINDYSLLYTWKGRTEDQPVLFMAHQDVVPAAEGDDSGWTHAPFSGDIADGYIWGRGTLDCKNQLIGSMEAVELLLSQGFTPERTVYLAFGHDEEIGGNQGATMIVEHLQQQGVQLAAVLDEGGSLIIDALAGLPGALALIGTAEKGHADYMLTARAEPGHSSTPPTHTAIGRLAAAIRAIEHNPMPAHVDKMLPMMKSVGPRAPFMMRMAFANLWLFRGIVRSLLAKNRNTNALIRNSISATMISGGVKENILPAEAKVNINVRILPGYSIEDVRAYLAHLVKPWDIEIEVRNLSMNEASPTSPMNSTAYHLLTKTIRQLYGDVPVAPYLMLGGTDARLYTSICAHVFRFSPMILTHTDLERVHGINERIACDDFSRSVQFFLQIVRTWSAQINS